MPVHLVVLVLLLGLAPSQAFSQTLMIESPIQRQTQVADKTSKKEKSPVVACILSVLMPGLGQFYNEESRKAMVQIGTAIGGFAAYQHGREVIVEEDEFNILRFTAEKRNPSLEKLGLAVMLGSSIWSIIDAPLSADKINQRNRAENRVSFKVSPAISGHTVTTRLTLRF